MSLPSHKNLLEEYRNPVFIETGTFKGDGVKAAAAAGFEMLMSVDIDPHHVEAARLRIQSASFYCGDSCVMLPQMIRRANGRNITFWLDAHYHRSPLMHELDIISRHTNGLNTILIDDVRLFASDYGFTVCDVVACLRTINRDYIITLVDGYVPGDILVARAPEVLVAAQPDQRPLRYWKRRHVMR